MMDALSEDARWSAWKAKGRADDLRSRRRLTMVVVGLAGAGAAFGAIVLAFGY